MTQCSARHAHESSEHYCIRSTPHDLPHRCEWGHEWGIRIIPAEPVLPYPETGGGATQGWSGSDTSHERAVREADDGTASRRQQQALGWLGEAEARGVTWKELADWMGWHHGQASSVLSVLHKEGRIDRLVERRDRCHIYVLPGYVNDRDTQPHGGRQRIVERDESLEMALADLDRAERKLAAIRVLCEEYALLDPGQVMEILDGSDQRQEE